MRYGFWLPVFGGWLRNVQDEEMPATFEYVKDLAQQAEFLGYDLTLIAELNLNDIKGIESPSLDAWSTAAAIAAVTKRLEILTAIRPGFHNPALTAKAATNIDQISGGRFSLNVVSAWWEGEAKQYGGIFTAHDERYARTEEFIAVLKGLWKENPFTYRGHFYQYENTYLSPKPTKQHIPLYAGGESETGKQTIAKTCDSYVMHGGTVEEVAEKIEDMKKRRQQLGDKPLESFGMSAYVICRDTEEEVQQELARITEVKEGSPGYEGYKDFVSKSHLNVEVQLKDYSVSNRGLRPDLIGTPEQLAKKIIAFEEIGVNLLILQFSPQHREMKRFAEQVMPLVEKFKREKQEV